MILLIGFEYSGKNRLPGIVIDLYLAYNFFKQYDKEIVILSDIESDSSTPILRKAIIEQIVNSDILSFIEECKEKNIYKIYKSQGYYNNFESCFKSKDEKLFVYYTGHSKNGNILLPDNSLYSFDNFRNQLENYKQSIVILDCCESNGLSLPFRLIDNVYRLENTENFTKSRILCISSSLSQQNSIASKTGSFFTRYIFNLLLNKNISLTELMSKLNNHISFSPKYQMKQTVNIFASRPDMKWIYGWLWNLIDLDFKIDSVYDCIEISLY